MANRVKAKLERREISWGVWLDWLYPNLIELYGYLGFDYVVIDAEHLAVNPVSCQELVRACDVVGLVPIVRVPENNHALILGYLEIGVSGIYVPHVKTAEDARRIVRAVKYAPLGTRSDGGARASRYGLAAPTSTEFFRTANEDTMVVAQIEDAEAMTNLEEIINVPGIDVFGIGDGDLAQSMGHPGDRKHPDVVRAVLDAEGKLNTAGRPFDAVIGDVTGAEDALKRGSIMISVSDRDVLMRGCRELLERARG